jgi:probable addiction module antidote protein
MKGPEVHNDAELAVFLQKLTVDSDAHMIPFALRAADNVLAMSELARHTGWNREMLYRTLCERSNPRLGTLAAILDTFGLWLAVEPIRTLRHVTP